MWLTVAGSQPPVSHSQSHIKGCPLRFLSLILTTTTTMPNSTITLVLCFVSFICGQVFQAGLRPSPAKVVSVAAVAPGFSLAALISVIVALLVIHDAVLILFLHHLGKSDVIVKTKSAHLDLKSLMAAADNAPRPRCRTLLLLPPVPVTTSSNPARSTLVPPRSLWVLPLLKMHCGGVPLIPRPFWTRAIYQQHLGPRAALPIEQSPALALAPKLSIASIASHPQDGVPLFSRLAGDLGDGEALVCGHESDEDTGIQSIEISSSIEERFKEEPASRDIPEPLDNELDSDSPEDEEATAKENHTQIRPLQAPFLLHIAASALLRRLQFRVIEEASCASIEEVVEEIEVEEHAIEIEEDVEEDGEVPDTSEEDVREIEIIQENVENVKKVAEESVEEDVEEEVKIAVETVEENVKESVKAAVELVEEDLRKTVESAKEPVENVKEPVEEYVKKTIEIAEEAADAAQLVQENVETAGKVPVQAAALEVEEETETHSVEAPKTYSLNAEEIKGVAAAEDVAAYDEYDDLPSYEEFVRDVPTEPLFEVKPVDVYDVCRPPPLSGLAGRTTATTRHDARARGSHIGLLSRLSSRVSAPVSVSA
ncbi:hypothetical protein DFH06DRAFT_1463880 [Mycena polygramma]|nr:hypothetical protein DFH06DRAFT_1463880 [Mycena polygramma]